MGRRPAGSSTQSGRSRYWSFRTPAPRASAAPMHLIGLRRLVRGRGVACEGSNAVWRIPERLLARQRRAATTTCPSRVDDQPTAPAAQAAEGIDKVRATEALNLTEPFVVAGHAHFEDQGAPSFI